MSTPPTDENEGKPDNYTPSDEQRAADNAHFDGWMDSRINKNALPERRYVWNAACAYARRTPLAKPLPPASETATPLTDAKEREIAPLGWESSFKHMLAFAQCLEGSLAAATRELDSLKEERTQFMSVIKSDTQAACDLIAERDQLRSDLLLARQQGEEMRKQNELYREELRDMAQEVADIGTTAHCISLSGPATTPTLQDAWSKFDQIDVRCSKVVLSVRNCLATPSPQGNNGEQNS